jgi:hypothetical protein
MRSHIVPEFYVNKIWKNGKNPLNDGVISHHHFKTAEIKRSNGMGTKSGEKRIDGITE